MVNGVLVSVNKGVCAHRKASEREAADRVGVRVSRGGKKLEDPKT